MKTRVIDRSRRTRWTVTALATASLAVAGAAMASPRRTPATHSPSATPVRSIDDLSVAFEHVAESIHPSVVSIRSVHRARTAPMSRFRPIPGFPFGDLFGFEDPSGGRSLPQMPPEGFAQAGLGSGVVVSKDGYILTNHHVVKDADEVTVTLSDDSNHTAEVVGTDPKTDLAVLRIDADDLVPAPLGDDSNLRVGHWVAAVGNPFGLSSTMTAGIVSAVGRSRVGLADYEDFIQTDAAINPGNSGGPLVNLAGEVVGINTAIFSRNGGYMGIGFAIPINMAKKILFDLIDSGHVDRGFLGVIIQDLDPGLADSFGFHGTDGALVGDVSEDGPAAKAGIEAGDIITRFDDQPIDGVDTLRLLAAGTAPGTKVSIELVRDGAHMTREVVLGTLESPESPMASRESTHGLGLALEDLTPRAARALQLPQQQEGVLVTGVEPFGKAAEAGLRLNDVILAVDGDPVKNTAELERRLDQQSAGEGVRLTVLTGSARRFVFLRLDD